jgi:hypothetical protein
VRTHATSNAASYALVLPVWLSTTPGAFCDVAAAVATAEPSVAWSFRAASTALAQTTADEAFGYRAVATACGSAVSGLPILVELSAAGVQVMADVFNAFNSNAAVGATSQAGEPPAAINTTFGSDWLKPFNILQARYVKFGAQLNF